ncbi:General transcription factor II-I repeat domain-containing protein 2 [Eumeta japonica]|uniref:General transcription factor II-I repeat domain-containing protein 2 n=1 Tax=Eumeta variegata TaxID=151549 RepID=A0A4C1Y5J1_EUMVA|nr:General transcription factor II-I repeat domain-containing protein 2 [Eumeta japonica]
MLKRFYEITNEIANFMQIKNKPQSELCDLAFLINVTDLKLKLQKRAQLVKDVYSHLKAFQNKIRLWEAQTLSVCKQLLKFGNVSLKRKIVGTPLHVEKLVHLSEQLKVGAYKNANYMQTGALPRPCTSRKRPQSGGAGGASSATLSVVTIQLKSPRELS